MLWHALVGSLLVWVGYFVAGHFFGHHLILRLGNTSPDFFATLIARRSAKLGAPIVTRNVVLRERPSYRRCRVALTVVLSFTSKDTWRR